MPSKTKLTDVYSTIIDNIKPNHLSQVVPRLKTTSKYFKDIDIGDDNRKKLEIYNNFFTYKDKYITKHKLYERKDVSFIKYKDNTILNIINLIINNNFILNFEEDKTTEIYFENNKFYFNALYIDNEKKYHNIDWFALCECTLEFKGLKPIFKVEKSYPSLSDGETIDDIDNMSNSDKRYELLSQGYYYQDIPFKVLNLYYKENKLTKLIINSVEYIDNMYIIIVSYK